MVQIKQENSAKQISINFNKAPFVNGKSENICCNAKWGLCFFESNPKNFNLPLAITSAAMCAAAYEKDSLLNNMQSIEFENIEHYNFCDGTSLCAYAFGMQKNEDFILVGIFVRGTSEGQWKSNFDLGSKDWHKGFFDSAKNVLDNLKIYFNKYNLNSSDPDSVKFYVTGHSKGGSVANIVGSRLVDGVGESNVYCYTFAAANIAKNKDFSNAKYIGIFNLVSSDDFISQCPLKAWGYNKFGNTVDLLKAKSIKEKEQILNETKIEFNKLTNGDELNCFDVNQNSVSDFINNISAIVNGTDEYNNKLFLIGETKVTLHDYFNLLSSSFDTGSDNDIQKLDNMIFLMSSMATELAPITQFVLQGIDDSQKPSPVMHAHTCETYIALLLRQNNDSYFVE